MTPCPKCYKTYKGEWGVGVHINKKQDVEHIKLRDNKVLFQNNYFYPQIIM